MPRCRYRVALPLALLFACGLAPTGRADPGPCTVAEPSPIYVEMETREGRRILLSLLPDDAPCTVNNFLNYIDAGAYDDSIVHRSVPNFVIQGGGFTHNGVAFADVPTDPAVVNEPGVSNLRGTIAMARSSGVNSATSQWFINLEDNLFLDTSNEGFTVFGNVVSGMPVVDAIEARTVIDACFALDSQLAAVFQELPKP